jgi:transcription antitermination factor NusG
MEDVIEFKGGRKVVVQKKVFPATCCLHGARRRLLVSSGTRPASPRSSGTSRPTPLSRAEVEGFSASARRSPARACAPRLEFEVGEQVRVVRVRSPTSTSDLRHRRRPFKLTVLVNIFGRRTPSSSSSASREV